MDRDYLIRKLDEDEELTDSERREIYHEEIQRERDEEDRYYDGS